jgi:hypothetical protein
MRIFGNKLDQHSLNSHPELNQPLKKDLDSMGKIPDRETSLSFNLWGRDGAFSRVGNKDHILRNSTIPGWFIKRQRSDEIANNPNFRSDTNLYRVRSAAKISAVTAKNGDNGLIVVPKEYVYTTRTGEQIVVSEEIQGQTLTYRDKLNANEAEALCRIITQTNFSDINADNFLRTPDGKLAIVDTEPVARGFKKAANRGILSFLFGRFANVDVKIKTEAFTALTRFSKPEALPLIQKAQSRYMWKQTAIAVAKIAIGALLLVGAIMNLPLVAPATLAFKAAVIGTYYLKAYVGVKCLDLVQIHLMKYVITKMTNDTYDQYERVQAWSRSNR